ncbi:MAG: hypothetical protein HC936_15950 [Leptolyngbyaceae cyanobacterium SU_3_3]|nr:hypothetical protein [Leptolyngbyaceae cyanobacterium SU_3_3]
MSQTGGTRSTNENITQNGKRITCEWYNAPLVSEAGEVIGVASFVMDISDRRRAEITLQQTNEKLEARVAKRTADLEQVIDQLHAEIDDRIQAETELRASQQLLQNILDNTGAYVFVKDYLHNDGKYLLMNRQFEVLLNCDRQAMRQKNDYDLFPKPIADQLYKTISKFSLAARRCNKKKSSC